MTVVDASVLIAFLRARDVHHQRAIELITYATELRVHVMTLAETLVQGIRIGRLEEMKTDIASVGVQEIGRLPEESTHLARLRVETGLKLPDCCVLVAAESLNASLLSFDDRLTRAAAARDIEVAGR